MKIHSGCRAQSKHCIKDASGLHVTGIQDVVAQSLKRFYQLVLVSIPHLDDQPLLASYLAAERANTPYAATQFENGRGQHGLDIFSLRYFQDQA
jgi:hypothetical protein